MSGDGDSALTISAWCAGEQDAGQPEIEYQPVTVEVETKKAKHEKTKKKEKSKKDKKEKKVRPWNAAAVAWSGCCRLTEYGPFHPLEYDYVSFWYQRPRALPPRKLRRSSWRPSWS